MRYRQFLLICLMIIATTLASSTQALSATTQQFPHEKYSEEKIMEYSTDELLAFLCLNSINWQYETYDIYVDEYAIMRELIRRQKEIDKLLKAFENPVDETQQKIVARALLYIDDDKIYPVFKKHINYQTTDIMYSCLNYLAKRGDLEALKILNDNYFQYGSSLEWSETVRYFGKYKYKPAIANLIESLDAASLNLVGAALQSLEEIFEGPHPDFKSISEMKIYFENLYEKSR